VNPQGPEPLHAQIAAAVKADIRSGQLPPGGKLPSTRKLAEQFGVSGMTAIEAIKSLRDEGLIFTTQRGSFVVDAEGGTPEPSPSESAEYAEIKDFLASLDEQVRSLAGRLAEMEAAVQRIESGAHQGKSQAG